MENKKWYTYKHSIIMLSTIAILTILLVLSNIEINIEEVANSNQKQYEYVSYILKNESKEKIEKIITDKDISSEDMKKIFSEREQGNQNFEKYTICFFSSKDTALKSNSYELGYVSNENGDIITKNIKEEEQKKAEEEKLKQKEQQKEEEAKKREEEEKKKVEEAKKNAEQKEKKFKESCKEYSFEELARNPDKMKDKPVKLVGEVIQVSEGIYTNGLRVNITKSEYEFYEDTIYVTYVPEDGADKILEDDIITIWGTTEGEYTYTSIMGASITVPYVSAEYIEIN